MDTTKKPLRILLEEPSNIVDQALQTLGLNRGWLAELMGISEAALMGRLNIKSLKCCEWYQISNALYLPVGSISFGYERMSHKANIRWALRDGYYFLPRTWVLWKLRIEIWKDLLHEIQFQSTHYGLRLRWKVRYQDFLKWLKEKINREHSAYNPVKDAWDYFHPETLDGVFGRPGLRIQLENGATSESELHRS